MTSLVGTPFPLEKPEHFLLTRSFISKYIITNHHPINLRIIYQCPPSWPLLLLASAHRCAIYPSTPAHQRPLHQGRQPLKRLRLEILSMFLGAWMALSDLSARLEERLEPLSASSLVENGHQGVRMMETLKGIY